MSLDLKSKREFDSLNFKLLRINSEANNLSEAF